MFERRGSLESLNRWRGQSPTGSERRKLSFNPIAEWQPPVRQEEPEAVGAFEVSAVKRIAQVAIAVVYCLLSAGVVFGYAAIKPVLVEQGVYKDLCTKSELDEGVWVCYGQEIRLNLMFTLAAVSTNLCALVRLPHPFLTHRRLLTLLLFESPWGPSSTALARGWRASSA